MPENPISLSTWLYDYLSVSEMMRSVKRCGYENIEISGYFWRDKWPWEGILRSADRNNLNIISVHCPHHKLPEEKMNREYFEHYHKDFYQTISSVPGLIVVEHAPQGPFEKMRKKAITEIDILKRLAGEYKLVLSLENVMESAFETEEEGRYLLQDSVDLTFDVAHALYLDIDPMRFRSLFPRIVNMHVYDVDREIGLGLEDWLPIGLGKGKWEQILGSIVKAGYNGPLTVELNEQKVKRVFALCQKLDVISGKRNMTSSLNPTMREIDDLVAIYSRRYLEELIQGKR